MRATCNVKAKNVMMRDFYADMTKFSEKYWQVSNSESYWDSLTDDATALISKYQTDDMVTNNLITNIVAAFLNSREEM